MILYSVKCLAFCRGSYSLPFDESDAELRYARKVYRETKQLAKVICFTYNETSGKIHEHLFAEDTLITTMVPYTSRNITLNFDTFTRDPAKDPWIVPIC